MDDVILKRDGFWLKLWDGDRAERRVVRLPLDLRFFYAWNDPLTIRGTVRLKDIVAVLRGMDEQALAVLARICGVNVAAYLASDLVPKKDPRRKGRLKFIEIYKEYRVDNYALRGWELCGSLSAGGIDAKGAPWAIEFIDWAYLLDLPIKLAPTAELRTTTWRRSRKRRLVARGPDRKPLLWSNRDVAARNSRNVRVTYTLGDFFFGLLDELCFHRTPADRDEAWREVQRRAAVHGGRRDEAKEERR